MITQLPRIFAVVVVSVALLLAIIPSKNLLKPSSATPDQSPINQNISDKLVNQEQQSSSSALSQDIGFKDTVRGLSGPSIPILYYHYIEVNPDPVHDPGRSKLLVTPDNFASQLQYLKSKGYTPITMDDVAAALADPKLLPSKPIVLSFDDGYEDFYQNAWPLLQKYNVKATIYVLSRGGRNGACNTNIWQPNFYMTSDQITSLSNSPLITVGAHTQDHCSLRGKPIDIQRQEIWGSKQELEVMIGKPVTTFAYPYGAFDPTTVDLVRQAGFTTAVTTLAGTIQNESVVYLLRRLHVGNYDGVHLGSLLAKYGN